MAITTRLTDYLDEHHVKYVTIKHSRAYTAQEVAASAHVRGQEVAKAVIIKTDKDFLMAVLPAHHRVELEELAAVAGADYALLASETEFKERFPDCETGAMPIFGNLYDLPVYVAEALTEDDEIVFNAGSHTEAIRLKFADFVKLAQPTVADFSEVNN